MANESYTHPHKNKKVKNYKSVLMRVLIILFLYNSKTNMVWIIGGQPLRVKYN